MSKMQIFTYGAVGHDRTGEQLATCYVYGWCQAPTADAAKIYAANRFAHHNPGVEVGDVQVTECAMLNLDPSKFN